MGFWNYQKYNFLLCKNLQVIEFLEYETHNTDENKIKNIKIDDKDESKDEMVIGKMNFDPIEYGSVIEGNEKVLSITPSTECSLKLNLI